MPRTASKLPVSFKSLFWSYNFSAVDPAQNKKEVVVQTINYGSWQHWQWMVKYYGKENLRKIISNIPASEFRKPVLELVKILFNIKKFQYVTRGEKIHAIILFSKKK